MLHWWQTWTLLNVQLLTYLEITSLQYLVKTASIQVKETGTTNCCQFEKKKIMTASNLENIFWAKVMSTACYIMKICVSRSILEKTPYELLKGRKTNISQFRHFIAAVLYITMEKII